MSELKTKLYFYYRKYSKSSIKFLNVLFIASCIALVSCSKNGKEDSSGIIIKGKVINPPREFIEFKERDSPSTLSDTIRLNGKGEFEIRLKSDTLKVYKIIYGTATKSETLDSKTDSKSNLIFSNKTQEITLMLDKGFDLNISVDSENPQNSLTITGMGSELNNYSAKKTILSNEFSLKYAKLIKSEPSVYLNLIDENRKEMEKLVNTYLKNAKYVSEEYIQAELKSIMYNYYRLKINYAKANLANGEQGFIPDENYFSFLKEVPFNNKEELSNKNYLSLINTYVDYLVKKDNTSGSIKKQDELSQKHSKLREVLTDPEIKDMLVFDFLRKNNRQSDQDWYINALKEFTESSSNDSLKKEIVKIKETRDRLSKGNLAPDFTYRDINGKDISLSDFKGKYVYADIWATWCKPCLYEVPFLKELEEDYSGRNIVFISISIDEDTLKWRSMVTEKNMKGIQLYTSTPETKIMKDYMIGGIPRFLFIGPGGEIIYEDAPRPSNPEIRELFETFSGL